MILRAETAPRSLAIKAIKGKTWEWEGLGRQGPVRVWVWVEDNRVPRNKSREA